MLNLNNILGRADNAVITRKVLIVALVLSFTFATNTEAQTAGGSAGPDLLGIRVGMTPEEALSILKARAPKEKWQTVNVQLKFEDAKQTRANVPNGTFRAVLENKRAHSALNHYVVFLTPTPGKEHVVAVLRIQNFGQDRPLFDQVIAGLIEKYGKPSYREEPKYGGGKLVWAFDADGKSRPLGIAKSTANSRGFPCTNGVALPYLDPGGWSVNYEPEGIAFDIGGKKGSVPYVKACGSTMVRATIVPFGGIGAEFAQALIVELIDHAAATAGKEHAVKLIDAAVAEDLARERGAAQNRSKPDI